MTNKKREINPSPTTITAPPASPTNRRSSFFSGKNLTKRRSHLSFDDHGNQKVTYVSFAEFCKVVLIPTRHEYRALGIFLWWLLNDYSLFKNNYKQYIQKEEIQKQKLLAVLNQLLTTIPQEESSEENNRCSI